MRWIARTTLKEDGILKNKFLDTHQCTEEDFADFYPLKESDDETFEALTSNGVNFQCLNWTDELSLKA